MVKTRAQRLSHASDDDARQEPGSQPGGPDPPARKNRIQQLRAAIENFSPRKPGKKIFDLIDAEVPAERRVSWEGPSLSAKPAEEEVYEGHGTLEEAYQLPPPDESPYLNRTSPPISFAQAHEWKLGRIDEAARDYEKHRVADESSLTAPSDLSFRTAEPEQARKTPAEPAPDTSMALVPAVKLPAPSSDSGSVAGDGWHVVKPGDIVEMDEFVPVKRGSTSKRSFTVSLPPAFSGPATFPPWFHYYTSNDNAYKFEAWPQGQQGPVVALPAAPPTTPTPSMRPDSRTSNNSSVPTLLPVSETASEKGKLTDRYASVDSDDDDGARPGQRSIRQILKDAERSRQRERSQSKVYNDPNNWIIRYCIKVMETYDENGPDATLALLCADWPENDVSLNRQWLSYLLDWRAKGEPWSIDIIKEFMDGRWPSMILDPFEAWGLPIEQPPQTPQPVASSSKAPPVASPATPALAKRPPEDTPEPPPGKGKGVDPRERPAATSTPKSVRFSLGGADQSRDSVAYPPGQPISVPIWGPLPHKTTVVEVLDEGDQPSQRPVPQDAPQLSSTIVHQSADVRGQTPQVPTGTKLASATATTQVEDTPGTRFALHVQPRAEPAPRDPVATPRAKAAPPGGYYSQAGGLRSANATADGARKPLLFGLGAGGSSDEGYSFFVMQKQANEKDAGQQNKGNNPLHSSISPNAILAMPTPPDKIPSGSGGAGGGAGGGSGGGGDSGGNEGGDQDPGRPSGDGGPPVPGGGGGSGGGGGPTPSGGNGGSGGNPPPNGGGGGGPGGGSGGGNPPPNGGGGGLPGGGGGPPPPPPPPAPVTPNNNEDDDLTARRKLAQQMKLKQPRVYDGRVDIDYFDQWCYEIDSTLR